MKKERVKKKDDNNLEAKLIAKAISRVCIQSKIYKIGRL